MNLLDGFTVDTPFPTVFRTWRISTRKNESDSYGRNVCRAVPEELIPNSRRDHSMAKLSRFLIRLKTKMNDRRYVHAARLGGQDL